MELYWGEMEARNEGAKICGEGGVLSKGSEQNEGIVPEKMSYKEMY